MLSRYRALAAAWIGFAGLLSASGSDADIAALQRQWAARLVRTESAGTLWAAQVVSLRSGRVWIETNAALRMVPASNTKLITAALALDRLGPTHRRTTSLRIASAPDASGRLPGPLRLVGGGDPTLAPRYHGGSWEQVWKPLVDAVKQAGIRRVDGGLLCDEGRFRGPPYGSGWAWEDLAEGYGAAVSALSAGDNVATLVVTPGGSVGAPAKVRLDPFPDLLPVQAAVTTAPSGSPPSLQLLRLPGSSQLQVRGRVPLGGERVLENASVPAPAVWAGRLFQQALRDAGIEVAGSPLLLTAEDRPRLQPAESSWREIASMASPPVGDLVREMMKPSQNLHAQLLLLAVGEAASEATTTEAAGLARVPELLKSAGIEPGDVFLEEGSGLSRKNLVTPRALVRLLAHMRRHPASAVWMASLPVGGVDGTLRHRFTEPPTKGNVRAKTGTLQHVQALSGYVTNAAGEPLVFSILANGALASKSGASPRATLDALVADLAASTARSD